MAVSGRFIITRSAEPLSFVAAICLASPKNGENTVFNPVHPNIYLKQLNGVWIKVNSVNLNVRVPFANQHREGSNSSKQIHHGFALCTSEATRSCSWESRGEKYALATSTWYWHPNSLWIVWVLCSPAIKVNSRSRKVPLIAPALASTVLMFLWVFRIASPTRFSYALSSGGISMTAMSPIMSNA